MKRKTWKSNMRVLCVVTLVMVLASHVVFTHAFLDVYSKGGVSYTRISINDHGEAGAELFLLSLSWFLLIYLTCDFVAYGWRGRGLFVDKRSIE
jgi:hypothetical protein